jgi:D-alanyl-D-alanine carboxypeptidase (penicillin-binding protein 5/6)
VAGGGAGAWQLLAGGGGPDAAEAAKAAKPRRQPARIVRPVAQAKREALVTAGAARLHLAGPALRAKGAALIDAATGELLWARYPRRRLPIASTTKIMTAVLALERLGPQAIVVVDRSVPRVAPYREGLRAGERVEAWKLLYGLMLYSGNDDALALAIASAGSREGFLAEMNGKARELGLLDTHFTTPSGVVDRGNYSSAWDLAALARYAMRNSRFRAIVRTRVKHVPWAAPTYAKTYVNHNHLLGSFPGADGIKTGWTTVSEHCIVASATRGGRRLIAVVIGSADADRDARRLLTMGFSSRG